MDIERLIRLRSTVRAAAQDKEGVASTTTYEAVRSEVRGALPDDLGGEFDRLFGDYRPTGVVQGRVMLERAKVAFALGKLQAMAGWLDGIIEAAQYQERMAMEAEAYARERVKAERGIGFQPPESG